jgi:hypothetical protein
MGFRRGVSRALFFFLIFEGGPNERAEERVRLERLRFKLRMKMAAEKPRMLRRFYDFHVIFIGRAAGNF